MHSNGAVTTLQSSSQLTEQPTEIPTFCCRILDMLFVWRERFYCNCKQQFVIIIAVHVHRWIVNTLMLTKSSLGVISTYVHTIENNASNSRTAQHNIMGKNVILYSAILWQGKLWQIWEIYPSFADILHSRNNF